MKSMQTVESYWNVWLFNDSGVAKLRIWEPFDEGFSTKRAAAKSMRESQKKYPGEKFALVHTTNTRVRTP